MALDPRDEAVFDQFTRVTGIPYPVSVERFLPPGGLFVGRLGLVGLGVMLLIGWLGKMRQDAKAEAEQEERDFQTWRESRVNNG